LNEGNKVHIEPPLFRKDFRLFILNEVFVIALKDGERRERGEKEEKKRWVKKAER
jgi:hypothetical protein